MEKKLTKFISFSCDIRGNMSRYLPYVREWWVDHSSVQVLLRQLLGQSFRCPIEVTKNYTAFQGFVEKYGNLAESKIHKQTKFPIGLCNILYQVCIHKEKYDNDQFDS